MNENMYAQKPSDTAFTPKGATPTYSAAPSSGLNRDRGTGGSQSTRTEMQNRASGYHTERRAGSGITEPASVMLRQARRAEQSGSTAPATRTLRNADAGRYRANAQAHERRMQALDRQKAAQATGAATGGAYQDPLGTSQQTPGVQQAPGAPQRVAGIQQAGSPVDPAGAPQPESTSGVGEGWRDAGVGEGWRDAGVGGGWRDAGVGGGWRGQKPVNEQPIMQVPDPYQGMGGFAPQPMADESNVEFMQPLSTFGGQHTTSLYEDPLLGY